MIHDHGFRPKLKFHGKGPLFYGVELEMEGESHERCIKGASLFESDPFWSIQMDSSLNCGIEAVSQPATIDYWRGKDLSIFRDLRDIGMKSYQTTTAGMHVHMSNKALTALDRLKLIEFTANNANLVRELSRRRNSELERWANPERGNSRRYYIRKAARQDNLGRYAAINTCPRDTTEVRIFRGTLFEPAFRRNIELVHALVQFAKGNKINDMQSGTFRKWLETKNTTRILGKNAVAMLLPWVSEACHHNTANQEV